MWTKLQPDKDGNTLEPIFEEDRKNKKNNPGLDYLLAHNGK